ncbi:hypothetical protein CCHL11_06690 [Colletotrichum chlorophyti]|uniref:Uncharacterized protein n=1 Tax=Colletotrichum chlorophyti TaxID=708187 RepID=A0A1Q8RZ38_9PEZI|nr:hypothetical protein CCHL11_06690 [Colletotrichum chlorophyti]
MSAVKNLRAMFEQKADTSPPDRGRSPGLSSNGTETPPPARPLSKIRTNFVAIEKDGRIGLRRDPSNESSLSQRRLSTHTEGETSVSGQSDKTMATEDTSAGGYKTNIVSDPIPESPRRPDTGKNINGATPLDLGALTDQPSHNPDKHVDIETPTPDLLPGDPKQKSAIGKAATNGLTASKPSATKTAASKDNTKAVTKPSRLAPPAHITRAKTPTRSPTTAKAPVLGSKSTASKPHHETSKKGTEKTATSTPKSGTKPAGANKKPTPLQVSPPSGTGFVKPKPKSPTKPVRLPASLMAPTAAYVSKVKEAPRETLSRASGNQGRPASRASAAGATTATKTLKRQQSVINRPRPSIGPPPKKPAQDHPVTKKEKEVDENFLARMMRPTQSSSSKLTEKAPVTPPRHRNAKEGSSKKSSASKSRERAVSRPAVARTGSPLSKRETPIHQIAPQTARVETAEAAVELAQEAEGPVEAPPQTAEPKTPVTPEFALEEKVEEASPAKEAEPVTLGAETAAPAVEVAAEDKRPKSPELEELAQQAVKLTVKEGENHELRSPEEFEELLADEKDTVDTVATDTKTETA